MTPDQCERLQQLEHAQRLIQERITALRNKMADITHQEGQLRAQMVRLGHEISATLERRLA